MKAKHGIIASLGVIIFVLALSFLAGVDARADWVQDPDNAKNVGATLLADYTKYLGGLDRGKIESVDLGARKFRELFAAKNYAPSADLAYEAWKKMVDDVVARVPLKWKGVDVSKDLIAVCGPDMRYIQPMSGMKKETIDYLGHLVRQGIDVHAVKGAVVISPQFEATRRNFFGYLTEARQAYMETDIREIEEDSRGVGGPPDWEKFRSRLTAWEGYVVKYPKSEFKGAATERMKTNARAYIITDGDSVSAPGRKASYRKFLSKNRKSRYFKLVDGYFQYLDESKFKPNAEKAQKLLDKNGL